MTVKSGAAVCGPEEARKERREDPRLDDAYFDSYDSSVFSPDDSPALSSFPGKHSLGRDAIGPFGPRKQHHPNANHHHHHHHQHTKPHRPLHPPVRPRASPPLLLLLLLSTMRRNTALCRCGVIVLGASDVFVACMSCRVVCVVC